MILPIIYLAVNFIHPPQDWREHVANLFIIDVSFFNPEPGERIAFWLAVILFPLVSFLTL